MVERADIRFYVLNLARRPDRRARISQMLPPDLPVFFTSDWIGPFDGKLLDRASIEEAGIGLFPWEIQSDDPDWSQPLKLGEIGCTLHHLAAWRHAWETATEPYVVFFEDDAVLLPDFLDRLVSGLARLANGPDFDLLYLGRIHYEPAEDESAIPGFVRPGLSYGAHGYLLRRPALAALLEAGLEQAIIPADEFLPCMYLDHPRADLRARFPHRLRALAFEPQIMGAPPRGDSDVYWTPFIEQ
jgi:collagen beta-1,O-galactosyltransferase